MSGIQVLENIWLDDNTFIVDGKKITREELGNLGYTPKKVSVSPNNKKLLENIKDLREEDYTKYKVVERITKLELSKQLICGDGTGNIKTHSDKCQCYLIDSELGRLRALLKGLDENKKKHKVQSKRRK